MAARAVAGTRHSRLLMSAFLAAGTSCAHAPAPEPLTGPATALRFGSLVDGTGRVMQDAIVVVQGDRIVRVGSGDAAVPGGASVIDLRRYTAIPGMIDVHTHMTYTAARPAAPPPPRGAAGAGGGAPGGAGRGQPVPREQVALRAADNARKTLETGVTTVRDLGASNFTDVAVRDMINRGAMVGPRMFVAGFGLQKVTGAGRGGAAPGPPRGRVRDTTEIPEAVKTQVDSGADWIKMYGSTGTGADVSGTETFNFAEMKAAVDAAHRLGRKIAIHSYGPEGGRDAMLAGANSVEHPVDLDDATLAEFARRGTFYVPTIDHNRFYADNAALRRYTDADVVGLNAFIAKNLETTRRAFKAGVKIAMGSDAVDWMFGENTRELGWFVKAGMTPAQALATATTNAAELLGMSGTLGKVAPCYYADIVAVEGNPLTDINVVINNVRWVMKGGAVVVDHTQR